MGMPRRVFASHLSNIFDKPGRAFLAVRLLAPRVAHTGAHVAGVDQAAATPPETSPRIGITDIRACGLVSRSRISPRRAGASRSCSTSPECTGCPARHCWIRLSLRPWLGPGRAPWVIIGGESAGKAARPMRPEWRDPR